MSNIKSGNRLRSVGRPAKDRVKVGLSLATQSSKQLIDLAYMTGQTKSALVEKAIAYFHKRETKLQAKIEAGDKLDLKKINIIDDTNTSINKEVCAM